MTLGEIHSGRNGVTFVALKVDIIVMRIAMGGCLGDLYIFISLFAVSRLSIRVEMKGRRNTIWGRASTLTLHRCLKAGKWD